MNYRNKGGVAVVAERQENRQRSEVNSFMIGGMK